MKITERIHRKLAKRDRVGVYFRVDPALKIRVQEKAGKMRPAPTMDDILTAGLEAFLAEDFPIPAKRK